MSAVKGPSPFTWEMYDKAALPYRFAWMRTPWWKFWRPKWRQSKHDRHGTFYGFTYASDRQRARQFLKEEFGGQAADQN